MTRIAVLLLFVCAIAACSRQASQQNPATSQPPAGAAASSHPEPAPPPADATQPAPAATDQPAAGAASTPVGAATETPSASAAAPPAGAPPAAAEATAARSAPAAPAAPPAPRFREITIPADTPLSVTLETSLASDTNQVEDRVEGRLARAIVVSRTTVLPAGSRITGSVIDAKRSGRVKGRASIAVRFDRIHAHGESYRIETARIAREAGASTKSDVKKGGIGAGVGAVVGGIAGGGKGAAIGGVVGGAGTVMATRGKEVQLPAGTTLGTRLTGPLEVRVAVSESTAERNRSPEP
jgi:hypothetical protein